MAISVHVITRRRVKLHEALRFAVNTCPTKSTPWHIRLYSYDGRMLSTIHSAILSALYNLPWHVVEERGSLTNLSSLPRYWSVSVYASEIDVTRLARDPARNDYYNIRELATIIVVEAEGGKKWMGRVTITPYAVIIEPDVETLFNSLAATQVLLLTHSATSLALSLS